jgi:hypothetical protein
MTEQSTQTLRYLRNPEVVLREEDEEEGALLYNPDTNTVTVINPTGLFIWQRCDGQNNLEQIACALQQACVDAPHDQVVQDVWEFVDGLVQEGFIGTVGEITECS